MNSVTKGKDVSWETLLFLHQNHLIIHDKLIYVNHKGGRFNIQTPAMDLSGI